MLAQELRYLVPIMKGRRMHRRLSNQEWNAFEKLPGASTDNFECLWRAIVKCCYAGLGQFIQYKNHPGVEFTLRLTASVESLGTGGTVIGWQCKYFTSLRDGRALSSTQRREIEKSLSETMDNCPEVKVWILCVHSKSCRGFIDSGYKLN